MITVMPRDYGITHNAECILKHNIVVKTVYPYVDASQRNVVVFRTTLNASDHRQHDPVEYVIMIVVRNSPPLVTVVKWKITFI